jgi:hypothetical protein
MWSSRPSRPNANGEGPSEPGAGTTNSRTYREEALNYGWLSPAGLMLRKSHIIASHRPGDTSMG